MVIFNSINQPDKRTEHDCQYSSISASLLIIAVLLATSRLKEGTLKLDRVTASSILLVAL